MMKNYKFPFLFTLSFFLNCTNSKDQKKLETEIQDLKIRVDNLENANPKSENDTFIADGSQKEALAKVASNPGFQINTKINIISESCYHDPCSVGKTLSTKVVRQDKDETTLNVKVLGGSKDWDSTKIEWNAEPHEITVVCSKTKPRVSIGDQTDILTLNNDVGVPGVLISTAEIYFEKCHSSKLPIDQAVQKFHYNVKE